MWVHRSISNAEILTHRAWVLPSRRAVLPSNQEEEFHWRWYSHYNGRDNSGCGAPAQTQDNVPGSEARERACRLPRPRQVDRLWLVQAACRQGRSLQIPLWQSRVHLSWDAKSWQTLPHGRLLSDWGTLVWASHWTPTMLLTWQNAYVQSNRKWTASYAKKHVWGDQRLTVRIVAERSNKTSGLLRWISRSETAQLLRLNWLGWADPKTKTRSSQTSPKWPILRPRVCWRAHLRINWTNGIALVWSSSWTYLPRNQS